MAQVSFSVTSINDLKSIFLYIAADSEVYARQVVNRIYKRAEILETHIRTGRVVPEFNEPSIREIFEGSYRIIYKIRNENEVFVARIYHRARVLKKL